MPSPGISSYVTAAKFADHRLLKDTSHNDLCHSLNTDDSLEKMMLR